MKYTYIPQGVCSRHMEFEIDNGVLTDIRVTGGCNGNLQGICSLIKGARVNDVIGRLEGIHCKEKPTSCPDQIARGLLQAIASADGGKQ